MLNAGLQAGSNPGSLGPLPMADYPCSISSRCPLCASSTRLSGQLAVPTVNRGGEFPEQRSTISGGAATRWLALARPQVLVSVNDVSVHFLSHWSGQSLASIRKPSGYEELIKRVMNSAWWNVPRPTDELEHTLWSYRAALLDVLACEEHRPSGHS